MLTQIKGEGGRLGAKRAFSSFDSVLKVDQPAQSDRSEKFDGYLGFLVDQPLGLQKTMTSYGLGFTH